MPLEGVQDGASCLLQPQLYTLPLQYLLQLEVVVPQISTPPAVVHTVDSGWEGGLARARALTL